MFATLFSDEYLDSAYAVNYEKLYQEDAGGFCSISTIPWFLMGHRQIRKLSGFLQKLRDIGFSCCLVSNNRKKRVEPFAASVGAQFIEMAAKPSRKGYERAMERLGTNTGNTVFIGDQLFTDICGAKNAGPFRNILVKPIHPKEEIQIVSETLSGENCITFLSKAKGGEEFMNHIVVIGFMGSGKTRVGKRLSK